MIGSSHNLLIYVSYETMSVEQRGKRLANRRPMLSKYVDEMESKVESKKDTEGLSIF